jgi:hypothetical protein
MSHDQLRERAWPFRETPNRQTGQSDAIHSAEACASTVVKLMVPVKASMAVVCTVAI